MSEIQPIIYVRGYAMWQSEVDETVADPYMGFNVGSTKIRKANTGDVDKLFFESPVIRLMKDFKYEDVFSSGLELAPDRPVGRNSIIIFRYYEKASTDFGDPSVVPVDVYARDLYELMTRVRTRIEENEAAQGLPKKPVRFYLVAHSMGGLVVRSMLQNDAIGEPAEKLKLIDKIFTYATPHNGIDFRGINVPSFLSLRGINTFSRDRIEKFLGLKPAERGPDGEVNTLAGKFNPERFFCLVGTNSADYTVARGLSSLGVGPDSDGLVAIANAFVWGRYDPATRAPRDQAPRAYVHRSHSGYYGIVNSEEGYQNLTRFLFGDTRIEGELEVRDLSLPDQVEQMRKAGRKILASYNFEVIAAVRGMRWELSRRLMGENSAVFRKYDELWPKDAAGNQLPQMPGRDALRRPLLFTFFLRSAARVDKSDPSLGFSLDFGVQVPEYQVDGNFFSKGHFPGGYIFRDKINFIAVPPATAGAKWQLKYGFDSATPNQADLIAPSTVLPTGTVFDVPIVKTGRPGIDATLHLTASKWNDWLT